jgi:hypothetical protein
MSNKHIKTFSTLLAIREMQINTMARYHYKNMKRTTIKKIVRTPSVAEDVGNYNVDENLKWFSHFGKQYDNVEKISTFRVGAGVSCL